MVTAFAILAMFICLYLFLYQRRVNIVHHIANAQMIAIVKQTQWHLQTTASPQVQDDGSWQTVTEVEMVEVALNQRQTSNLFDTGRLLNADGLVTARPDLAAKSRSWSRVSETSSLSQNKRWQIESNLIKGCKGTCECESGNMMPHFISSFPIFAFHVWPGVHKSL